MYCVITENDISQWDDQPGLYHFPNTYLQFLQPGTKVIYYKSKMTDKSFADKRLSPLQHYFGIGEVESISVDPQSTKNYYAVISDIKTFDMGVFFKLNGIYLEFVPPSKKANYWRNGVRPISRSIYNKIIQLSGLDADVNPNASKPDNVALSKDTLVPQGVPLLVKSRIPAERTFNGVNINWNQKQSNSMALGELGENLVIRHERARLRKVGLLDKLDSVCKVKDGKGYDILSFNEKGDEIQIEVKTTRNDCHEPFYLSLNEKEYAAQYAETYYLYRLYNFDRKLNSAEFYILKGKDLQDVKMSPTNFEVSIEG